VVGRDVEHLEVADVVFDLGPFIHDEPELLEDVRDLGDRRVDRVERAATDRPAGRRDVDRLGGKASIELGTAQGPAPLGERGLDGGPDLVRDGTDLRAVLGGQRPDPAQDAGEATLLAEDVELERVEGRHVGRRGRRGECLRLERLEVAGQLREIH
jgi:hypothetical protein